MMRDKYESTSNDLAFDMKRQLPQILSTAEFEDTGNALTADFKKQLALLLATPAGTVVLDRDFGVDTSSIDMPMDVARTMLAAELVEKIDRYIPELQLKEVILENAELAGTLHLKVVVEIVE